MPINQKLHIERDFDKINVLFNDLASFGFNLYKTISKDDKSNYRNIVIYNLMNQGVTHFDAFNRLILNRNKSIILPSSLQVRALFEIEVDIRFVTLLQNDDNFSKVLDIVNGSLPADCSK